MTDDPPTPAPTPRLWVLLDAHLICAFNCQAIAQGWQIDGVYVTASQAAARQAIALGTRCWCCGTDYPEAQLVRLDQHPEVGVCVQCTQSLRQQAIQR
ncbi:hypothetical protein [Actinocrispum sp. NPDC049592]|uniref:hypothetical protein n=1 Tax=Actinocrispum sp. NPDC049592 TaxID=3154835 RepID=UPI00344A11E9